MNRINIDKIDDRKKRLEIINENRMPEMRRTYDILETLMLKVDLISYR